jgi:hypothetical protein
MNMLTRVPENAAGDHEGAGMYRAGFGAVFFALLMALYFVGKQPTPIRATLDDIRLAAIDHRAEVKIAMRSSSIYCLQKLTNNRSPASFDEMTGDVYSSLVDAEGFVGNGRFGEDEIEQSKAKNMPNLLKKFMARHIEESSPEAIRIMETNRMMKESGTSLVKCTLDSVHQKLLKSGAIAVKG